MIEGIEALIDTHEKIALTVRKVEQMSLDSSNYKKTEGKHGRQKSLLLQPRSQVEFFYPMPWTGLALSQ